MIAISTAFKKALIAVSIEGEKAFKELPSNCKHSENILPSLDELLSSINKNLSQNDCYSLVVGPGSFTGLRIGISLIKGFIAGLGEKKIVSITTNELMAYTYIKKFKPNDDFYCVIDALSNLYYISHFSSSGEKLESEKLIDQAELETINGVIIGLVEENVQNAQIKIEPSAQDLLELSQLKLTANDLTKPEELAPLYLRKSQAEVSLESKEKN